MYKLFKTYTTSSLKWPLHVFCTYTQHTNYTKCMQILIESNMKLPIMFFVYTKILNFLFFKFLHQQRHLLLF